MASITRFSRFILQHFRRNFRSSAQYCDDMETDGMEIKSASVSFISKEDEENLYVEAYSQIGFRLSNGFRIIGPCVIFPRSILHWAVSDVTDITEQSLSLFPVLEPKLDVLILGIGSYGTTYDKNIIKFLRSHKINVEILPTDQACATFNFLNSERRFVAAGLIPPSRLEVTDTDDMIYQAQLVQKQNIYELEHGYSGSPYDNAPGEFAPYLETLKKDVYPKLASKLGFETKEVQGIERKDQSNSDPVNETKDQSKSDPMNEKKDQSKSDPINK